MDPRPYNYEFRRPRPNNPTYQSFNAYQSIYHMGKNLYQPSPQNYAREQYGSKINAGYPNYSNFDNNKLQAKKIGQNRYEVPSSKQKQQSSSSQKQYKEAAIHAVKQNQGQSDLLQRNRSNSMSSALNKQPLARQSVLSTYGSNSLEKNGKLRESENNMAHINRDETSRIYQKQQKSFDIINFYSKAQEPLKKFPKITMENLILERRMDSS